MGGRETDVVLLDENGIRSDGRKVNETRKVTIKVGVLKNASGSAYIEFGGNKILAGVVWSKRCSSKTHVKSRYWNFKSKISYGTFFR